jgi:hypothetical protein
MKRTDMLDLIEFTIQQTTGCDSDTGDKLYAPDKYMAYAILRAIENAGICPQNG